MVAVVVAAAKSPAPSPSAAPGPCAQGALASISDRPGLGRAPASNGAACVALPGMFVLEAGYRNQTTVGPGTQTLSTLPNVVARFGLNGNNEVLAQVPTFSQRSGRDLASGFLPESGTQDAGFGFKHLLFDGTVFQDAVNVFVTLPTGRPGGTSGFSAGLPTYTAGYGAVLAASSRIGIASTQNFIWNAAPNALGMPKRFFAYQPSIALSYAVSARLSFLLQNQWSMPNGPSQGTGDRALAGVQFVASANVVVDGELEANLLPAAGFSQHAVDVGVTIRP